MLGRDAITRTAAIRSAIPPPTSSSSAACEAVRPRTAASGAIDTAMIANAASASPGPCTLIRTPAIAAPTTAPSPSDQLVTTFAAVSSSGRRTTSGINVLCIARVTPSRIDSPAALA